MMLTSRAPYRRLDSLPETPQPTLGPERPCNETRQGTTCLAVEAPTSRRLEATAGDPLTLFDVGHGREMQARLAELVAADGLEIEACATADEFLDKRGRQTLAPGCLVLDVHIPGMSGLELQQALLDRSDRIPLIFVAATADIPTVVHAMQSGALDFIVAPLDESYLLQQIRTAVDASCRQRAREMQQQAARYRISQLSKREVQVFHLLAQGKNTKEIANRLGIAHPTVSKHRGNVFAKLDVSNLMELALLAQRAL